MSSLQMFALALTVSEINTITNLDQDHRGEKRNFHHSIAHDIVRIYILVIFFRILAARQHPFTNESNGHACIPAHRVCEERMVLIK